MAKIRLLKDKYFKMGKCGSSAEKGAALIGIIVTIVLMAALGGGMLYFTTTSTYNELFVNNHVRAYYAAESGGRYALSVIRKAYADEQENLLDEINDNQTFIFDNDQGSFQITSFSSDGADPETVTFKSIGTVGSGLFEAKRELSYRIQPVGPLGGSNEDSGGPTGPIDFNDYEPSTNIYGEGGRVRITDDGLAVDFNTAAGGTGGGNGGGESAVKDLTVFTNEDWQYEGDYSVQIKLNSDGGGGANSQWHMGLMFNVKTNDNGFPYGFGLSLFSAAEYGTSRGTQLDLKTDLPDFATDFEKPILLLWQNTPETGLDWIAYAPIDEDVFENTITKGNKGWSLGSGDNVPTILVSVNRKSESNEIRVYLAGPETQGSPDTIPTNYNNRKEYTRWSSIEDAPNEIKWPSFGTGTWPDSNDYFTFVNADSINSSPSEADTPIAKWIRNTDSAILGVTDFLDDEETTNSSIPNAVISSSVLTGPDYSGVAFLIDPCGANPKGDFINLGIKADGGGGGDGGSGEVIVSP